MILQTKQEQKEWIKKRWSLSSGTKITEMLTHYWSCAKIPATTQKELEDILLK